MNLLEISRYIFGIGAAIVLALNVMTIARYSLGQNNLIWMIFAVIGCISGLVGAWKENFLTVIICTVIWAGLLAATYFKGIFSGYYYSDYGYYVLCGMSGGGACYAFILHSNGKKDMNFPKF